VKEGSEVKEWNDVNGMKEKEEGKTLSSSAPLAARGYLEGRKEERIRRKEGRKEGHQGKKEGR
jgi:hypothetical protein